MANKVVPAATAVVSGRMNTFFGEEHQREPQDDSEGDFEVNESDIMQVLVRGMSYTVDISKFAYMEQDSLMHKICEIWKERNRKGTPSPIYINRNPFLFHCVLDYHISGKLHFPEGICGAQLDQEMAFWNIGREAIAPCCLWKVHRGTDLLKKMRLIIENNFRMNEAIKSTRTLKDTLWIAVEYPFSTVLGKIIYTMQLLIYSLFLLSLILQSETSFREILQPDLFINQTLTAREEMRNSQVVYWLLMADFILLIMVSAMPVLYVAISPNRMSFFRSPMYIIGGVSLLIQWLPVTVLLFYSPPPQWYQNGTVILNSLKVLRIVPIIPMLYPFQSMQILSSALKDSYRELLLLLALLGISSLTFGYLVLVFEFGFRDSHFTSIPEGLWWGVVTLTTVGYGDFYPQTFGGRLTGTVCALVGIIIMALPVPIVSNTFTKIYDLHHIADFYSNAIKISEEKKAKYSSMENVNVSEKSEMKSLSM